MGLRDQIEEFKHKQQMEEGGFKPNDLKKRLKKFVHDFKSNRVRNAAVFLFKFCFDYMLLCSKMICVLLYLFIDLP